MNKYEKLIEYIINENEQKARELFHEIVVEKSRDIYESLMADEQVEENLGGDQAADLVDEVSMDETDGLAEEEFSLGDEEGEGDELGGDLGGEEEGEFGGEEIGGEASIEDLDAKLDDIADKIDALLADEAGEESGEEAGDEFSDIEGSDEAGEEEASDEEASDEEMFAEGENPFAKKGSGSGSGKSGSGVSGSGKSGSGVAESKSVAQLMREYVDTIGQVYGGEGDANEGTEVGNGKKVNVNDKSVSRTSGPDFGGTNKNIARGGAEQSPDGTSPAAAPKADKMSNEKFQNVAGGSKKQSTVAKGSDAEGQTTSGKVPVSDKTVLKQNTGK